MNAEILKTMAMNDQTEAELRAWVLGMTGEQTIQMFRCLDCMVTSKTESIVQVARIAGSRIASWMYEAKAEKENNI